MSLNRYPDPYQRTLRAALADYTGLSPEQVLAGAGSDEVLDWIFKVFCNPSRDEVAVAEPTYGMYRVMADIYDVRLHSFPLDENYALRAGEFLSTAPPRVKVMFLCSPNNPTGNLLERDEILRLCSQWRGVVVVDEAYVEFSEEASLAGALGQFPNLILLRTLSKAFGSAALRLGYACASPQITSCFLKVKAPYNLNAITMKRGQEALGDRKIVEQQVALIKQERERVAGCLQEIGGVEKVFPSSSNFLLFRCRSASEVYRRLFEEGIVIRDRSEGPRTRGCLRVTIGLPQENDLFLARVAKYLEVLKQ